VNGRNRRQSPNRTRAALVGAVLLSSTLAASPAMALNRDDGDDPGEGISDLEVLSIFVGIPVLSMAVIWVLVSIPSMIRGPRYRPGKEWQAGSEWYGAPGDEVEGGQGAPELEAGKGERASDGALTGTLVEPGEGTADSGGGGTSARW
jgi:hypothetical protein